MRTIESTIEDRNRVLGEAQVALNAGIRTVEEKSAYNSLISKSDELQQDIDNFRTIERHFAKNPSVIPTPAPLPVAKPEEQRARLDAAFRDLLKNGHRGNSLEQRDITTNDGAAVVPQEFEKDFVSALKWFGPISTLVKTTRRDNGSPTKYTVSDDTAATMTYLPETGSTASVEADPTLQSVIPGTDTLVTVIKYSIQELEDANDLSTFIRDIAGLRVARSVEYALTLGKSNGGNIVLPNSPAGGLLGNVPQGAVTASLAAGIPYSALVALASSVDHAYYVNGAYMASPSVFNYLLAQVDTTGRALYSIDPNTGLLQIAGKPLYVNNAMPAFNAASSPVVLFGDYSRAYAYLNGGGIQIRILTERFSDTFENAAVIYTRAGFGTLVSGAVKSLVTAAS